MTPLIRRDFLRSLALAAAAWPMGLCESHATENDTDLGFSLYGMKDLSPIEALQACARIGYRNVELALIDGHPLELKSFTTDRRTEIRKELERLNLRVSALMLNLNLAAEGTAHSLALESIAAAGEVARQLAPTRPPVIETVLGGKPESWESSKDGMVQRLQEWSRKAEDAGVVLTLKAHVGSAVNSPERLLWLLREAQSSALAAAYDYSHFQLLDLPLVDTLKQVIPHARFVHVKDGVKAEKGYKFFLPGEGSTDYVTYFRILRALGYTGPVVVEVSSLVFREPGYDPIAAATKCFSVLRTADEKALATKDAK